MLSITADSIDELYKRTLHRIMAYGETTYPRGFTCREISPCQTVLTKPQLNVLVNPLRKASKAFMAAELLWILQGRYDVEMISFYNSKIKEFSDDGKTFFGAYGPKIISQLPYIVTTLSSDPWSRQAIINIWRESPAKTRDVPCTISLQFIRRPLNELRLYASMRSQDIWLGFPYDVHNFTCIQMLIASLLGIKPGLFVLNQGSLHAYDQDYKNIQAAAKWTITGAESFTPDSSLKSMSGFHNALKNAETIEEIIRLKPIMYRNARELISYTGDPMFAQKLSWLYHHGAKKHAIS